LQSATVPTLSPAGDRALAATYYSGLIDVSDPLAPKHVGWPAELAKHIQGSSLDGELATLLISPPTPDRPYQGALQLVTLALADEGQGELIGSLDLPGNSGRFVRNGETTLVFSIDDQAHTAWLTSVRVSSDAAIELIAQLEWPYANDPSTMYFGRVMAAFAGDRVYIVRPDDSGARPSTQVLAVEVASNGTLSTPLDPITVDGLVLSGARVEESGGFVRVLAAQLGGDASSSRISMFGRDDLDLLGELAVPLEPYEVTIHQAVATIVGDGSVLIANLTEPPGELWPALLLEDTTAFAAVSIDERLLVQHAASSDGPVEISLYDLSGGTIAMIDTLTLKGSTFEDFKYSEELGLALYTRPESGLGGCAWRAYVELVRVSAEGLESLGSVEVFSDPSVTSVGGQLLLDAPGRLTAVSPVAPLEPIAVNTRFVPEQLALGGGTVIRSGRVEWSDGPWLDVVAQEGAAVPPLNGVALLPLDGAKSCAQDVEHLHRAGDYAFAMVDDGGREVDEDEAFHVVYAVDISDEAAPRVVSETVIPSVHEPRKSGRGYKPITPVFLGATRDALIFSTLSADDLDVPALLWLDLTDPEHPELRTLELEYGLGNALVSGSVVVSTHAGESDDFWLERIDLTDVASPRRLPALEVTGAMLAFDAASERALLRREPDESCSDEGWDLAIAELSEEPACVVAIASKQGRWPKANEHAIAELSYAAKKYRLRIGAWDSGRLEAKEVELPVGIYTEQIDLAGTHVVMHGAPTLIYDARCPDVAPTQVHSATLAHDAASNDAVILVRDGGALVPAPLPECER
jgi:hypothetical protein